MRTFSQIYTALAVCTASLSAQQIVPEVRIADLTELHEIRPNVLEGVGLITGLKGTGDGSVATRQTYVNYLAKSGIKVRLDQVPSGNIALVRVTAKLKPFARHGTRLDIVVSSSGEATSLLGGNLLLTVLRGQDREVYATASGPVLLGGFEAKGANAKITRNHPTAGVIPNGGICEPTVEKLVPNVLNERGELSLILPRPSAYNATAIVDAINKLMTKRKAGFARVEDPGNVRVRLLPVFRGRSAVNRLLAEIEALSIKPEQKAVVVVNEKTGTIIVSGNVRVMPCSVNVASLTIEVTEDELVSQPNPGISRGTTEKVGRTSIRVTEGSNKAQKLDGGASLTELLAGLQALGVEGRKLGTVLSELHGSGLLHGELIVR